MRREWGDPPGEGGFTGLSFPRLTDGTRVLLWANGIAFAVQFLLWRFALPIYDADARQQIGLVYWFALTPGKWAQGPLVPIWQLVTYGFLHSLTSIHHILYNMLGLYFFGTFIEGIVGRRRFLLTFLAAMIAGGLAQLILGLVSLGPDRTVPPTLGASGAVMCLIVAAAVMQPEMRVIFILFPLKLRTLALIMVGIDVFSMLSGSSGTAWLVHLTGAAYGFLAVRRRWIWRDPLGAVHERRRARAARRKSADEQRLERLLERIHSQGMGSLSRRERTFLKRVSRSRH